MGVFGTFFHKSKSTVSSKDGGKVNEVAKQLVEAETNTVQATESSAEIVSKQNAKSAPAKSAMQAYLDSQSEGQIPVANVSSESVVASDIAAKDATDNIQRVGSGPTANVAEPDLSRTGGIKPTEPTSGLANKDSNQIVSNLTIDANTTSTKNTTTTKSPSTPGLEAPRTGSHLDQQVEVSSPTTVETPVSSQVTNESNSPEASSSDVKLAWASPMDRKEVVTAYKIFLRRFPESPEVIEPRVGMPRERLLSSFLMSPEHLQHPEHIKLIFDVANQMIIERQAADGSKT